MANEIEQAILEEKKKRKEIARRRTFWFVLILDLALIAYIVIQVLMLVGAK